MQQLIRLILRWLEIAVIGLKQTELIEREAARLTLAVVAVVEAIQICIFSAREGESAQIEHGNVLQNDLSFGNVFHAHRNAHPFAERFELCFHAAERAALYNNEPPVLSAHVLQAERFRRGKRLFRGRRRDDIRPRDAHVGNGNAAIGFAERARAERPVLFCEMYLTKFKLHIRSLCSVSISLLCQNAAQFVVQAKQRPSVVRITEEPVKAALFEKGKDERPPLFPFDGG